MKFICKCNEEFISDEVWDEVGDIESGPCCEVVGMTVWSCPACGQPLAECKELTSEKKIEVEILVPSGSVTLLYLRGS